MPGCIFPKQLPPPQSVNKGAVSAGTVNVPVVDIDQVLEATIGNTMADVRVQAI